jgi:hypothetical protein
MTKTFATRNLIYIMQKPEDFTPKECPCCGWCHPRGDMEVYCCPVMQRVLNSVF